MIDVGLATAADCARRVALRVARGGHPVPQARLTARWSRLIAMPGGMAEKVDRLFVFDNTRDEDRG